MRVPVYEGPAVKIAPVATPQMSAIPDGGTDNAAKAFTQISRDAFAIAKDEQQKANQKALYDFRVGLDDDENNVSFGDDQTEGFLSLRGGDTAKHLDAYLEDFRSKIAERKKGAVNEEQKMAFDVMAAEREKRIEAQFRRHANTEFQTSLDASQKALEESTIRNIGNYYNDDVRFGQELAVLRQTIIQDAENKGQDVEVKKFRLDTMTSKAYSERIDRMMQESPLKAKTFLDENRDLMTSDDVAKYEKAVKPLVSKQEGMNTALELGAQLGIKDVNDLMAEARKKLKNDPDALNIAEVQLNQMEAERTRAIKKGQEAAALPIYTAMAEARKHGRIPSLSDFKQQDWIALVKADPDKANDIIKGLQSEVRMEVERRERKADRLEAKAEREQRQALLDEERNRARNQKRNFAELWSSPADLAQANIIGLVGTGAISPEQGKYLEDRRNGATEVTSAETTAINDVLGAAKIKLKTEAHDQAISYIAQQKAAFYIENKRPPTSDEIRKIARDSLYTTKDNDWIPFNSKPVFKLTINDVPKEERQKITAALGRKGRKVADSEIVRAYAAMQQKKGQ